MTVNDLPISAIGDLLTLQRQCRRGNAAILVRGTEWKTREIWCTMRCGDSVDGWDVVAVVKGAP